ncbi:MAG: glucose-1-phosphate adenylyltransferase [Pyrinomonadaceae bacterium MAG19_C2-C3]|nr:glucose-1-phosphate adenylyltransferase [Pyrinomonadaceae bacterium MAG19_C2-C3]
MHRPKVLALILAGGAGSRLEVLTAERAKPVMPFGGTYRLIDFALSNCMHSRINDVWVIEQYELHSLNEHLANGRPWDLDRTYGGLQVLPPFEADDKRKPEDNPKSGGFASGNADAIYRHRRLIQEFAPDLLIVLSADHIYKLDFRDVIEHHLKTQAGVTVVTTKVPKAEASRFGNVIAGDDGIITEFAYKPDTPISDTVTTEVFVYTTRLLFEQLDNLSDDANGEASLRDFGHQLLPSLVKGKHAVEFRLEGYWRDVGTLESYWQAHQDLLADKPAIELDDAKWNICTFGAPRVPARIHETARITNSMISQGCVVRGTVRDSVLARGVHVEAGAIIERSIILDDCRIEADAHISHAVIDIGVRIGKRARIGAKPAKDEVTDEDLTIIGAEAIISPETIVTTGARIQPRADTSG